MAEYLVRVEIHRGGKKVSGWEYLKLHEAMRAAGYWTQFSVSGVEFELPPAEYLLVKSSLTIDEVKEQVNGIVWRVLKVGQSFKTLVSQVSDARETDGPTKPFNLSKS